MRDSAQEQFIHTIKKALGKPPTVSRVETDLFGGAISAESRAILERIRNRSTAERKKLLDTLMEAVETVTRHPQSPQDDPIASIPAGRERP